MSEYKINLTKQVYEKVLKIMKESGCSTPDEYVEMVLKEVFSAVDKESGVEDEEVKKRLRALGYMD